MTETTSGDVSAYTDSVIDNDQPLSAYTARKERTRQAVRRHRRRCQHGVHRLTIDVTDAQLDLLLQHGYLAEGQLIRADMSDAVETFLADFL